MPAEEFDAYLKALSARLRLKPGRRAELADELRDHLETRLEELTADGLPRAAAIERALAEFGDAAGLASQMSSAFTVLARRRRRKTLMRVTASAAATLACGIAVAYLFAPPNRAVNPPGPAVAQDEPDSRSEPAASVADPFAAQPDAAPSPPSSPDEAKMAALEKALNAPTEFDPRPGDTIAEALSHLASQHDIVILPDSRALGSEGFDLRDFPIENPPQLSGYSLRTVLNVLLSTVNQAPLAAVPRDGILFITTQEAAGRDLETRIYNVRDLLTDVRERSADAGGADPFDGGQAGGAGMFSLPPVQNQFGEGMGGGMGGGMSDEMGGGMGGFAAGRPDTGLPAGAADDLVNMILSVTGGENFGGPWQIAEGTGGSIEHFNGLLAVRQTAAVHRQIEELLAALRRSAAERGWDGEAPAESVTVGAPLTLVVGPEGVLSINGDSLALESDDPKLFPMLAESVAPDRPVVVRSGSETPFQTVRKVLDQLAAVGLTNVRLETADQKTPAQ